MSKVVLLALTMVLAILYLALPYSEEMYSFFPLSDQELTLQMHVWFILNKLTLAILAYIIWIESTSYRLSTKVFFWVTFGKLIDYLICYNEVWFRLGFVPITSTSLGLLIFGLVIAFEYSWKDRQ